MKFKLSRIVLSLLLALMLVVMGSSDYFATGGAGEQYIKLDANGGTIFVPNVWNNSNGFNNTSDDAVIQAGQSIRETGVTYKDPTRLGYRFLGWAECAMETNEVIPGKPFLSTEEINNTKYNWDKIYKAQWEPLTGGVTNSITLGAFDNKTGEVDYDVTITIEADNVTYVGKGYLNIPEEVYSSWSGWVTETWEFTDRYIYVDKEYVKDSYTVETSISTILSSYLNPGIEYHCILTEEGEMVDASFMDKANDFFYSVSTEQPESYKTPSNELNVEVYGGDAIPDGLTMISERVEEGDIYYDALKLAQSRYNTSNILVLDLNLLDPEGNQLHQLDGIVEVFIPVDIQVEDGNTLVVFFLSPDGEVEECPSSYNISSETGKGYVVFATDHFSTYVITEVSEEVASNFGDSNSTDDYYDTELDVPVNGTDQTDPDEDTEVYDENMPHGCPGRGIFYGLVVGVVVVVAACILGIYFLRNRRK